MSEIIRVIGLPDEISVLAAELRETVSATEITTSAVLDGVRGLGCCFGRAGNC